MADNFNDMPIRFMGEAEMENTRDWLSRLLEMIPVKGTYMSGRRTTAEHNGPSFYLRYGSPRRSSSRFGRGKSIASQWRMKGTTVLAGSIVEALLLWALQSKRTDAELQAAAGGSVRLSISRGGRLSGGIWTN
jgi:hypothetical protein